jgi:hypothetical protein
LLVRRLDRNVVFESVPEEPDEDDPENRWGNPEEELVAVPEVSVPDGEGSDVDPELYRTFWAAVLFANIGLAGITIGPMLAYFRGEWDLALLFVVIGLFGLARTYAYSVQFRSDDPE